jgi:hypothetical protein
MPEINWPAYYAARYAASEAANKENKVTIMTALKSYGIQRVTVEFDGEGDSGQVETPYVTYANGDSGDALGLSLPVDMKSSSVGFDSIEASVKTEKKTLGEALEAFCYDFLEQTNDGWENNDGAYGTFTFEVAEDSVHLVFNGRYTEVNTDTYSL